MLLFIHRSNVVLVFTYDCHHAHVFELNSLTSLMEVYIICNCHFGQFKFSVIYFYIISIYYECNVTRAPSFML
jgi:hypothetical protein